MAVTCNTGVGLIVREESSAEKTRSFTSLIQDTFRERSWVVKDPEDVFKVNCDVAIFCVDKNQTNMLRGTGVSSVPEYIKQLNKKIGEENIMVVVYNEQGDREISSRLMKNTWPILSRVELVVTDELFNEKNANEHVCQQFIGNLRRALLKIGPIERKDPKIISNVPDESMRDGVMSDTRVMLLFFMQF
ncbi:uncharacterized protein LOC117104023, partial [Anneissia japonica]|uniref:uncharacterized protein LOC117104023 n=1 Tax=Anneissia japonica TaxID=1529436 RepID=UPI0014256C98